MKLERLGVEATQKMNYFPRFYKKRSIFVWAISTFVLLVSPTLMGDTFTIDASEDTYLNIHLEDVIVEGSLLEDTVQNTPKGISVVTSLDIEQNPGKSVVDLLASQPGINTTSYSGHDKKASIDLRGMGATANSNVLVIVDGIRLNAPDLSGADLSSIDLDDVEKIEVIRGSETVVYGDGAVGGVINIVTKKGRKKPVLAISASLKSYNTKSTSVHYSGLAGGLSYKFNAAYVDSDGYRENGYYQKINGGFSLNYQILDSLQLSLTTSALKDEYGLPGNVKREDVNDETKRLQAQYPDDYGETLDNRLIAGLKWSIGDDSELRIKRGYRFRENRFLIGYDASLSANKESYRGTIDEESRTFNLSYQKKHRAGLYKLGLDHYHSYYVRESNAEGERQNSNTSSLGAFFMNRWQLGKALKWNLGVRYNNFSGLFRKDILISGSKRWNNGEQIDKEWQNRSFDNGLVFQLSELSNFYMSVATNFRTPNVDELAVSTEDLKPQKGVTYEVGVHHDNPGVRSYSVGLFQMQTEDEIYYGEDPLTSKVENRNYEEITLRSGLEAELKLYPSDQLYLWGNLTYMTAKLQSSDARIPLVPEKKVNLGGEYSYDNQLSFTLVINWVDEREDGNYLQDPTYQGLPAYTVVNGKVSYKLHKGAKLLLGVNNLLNELYSTAAYSETYYPMPTRNYYCQIKWSF